MEIGEYIVAKFAEIIHSKYEFSKYISSVSAG